MPAKLPVVSPGTAAMPPSTSHETAERIVDEHAATPRAKTSFGAVGRRIASWTSSLLISAIILVAGLASGRQILHWWRDDPLREKSPLDPRDAALADDAGAWRGVEVGGQPWAMRVCSVVGDRAAAEKELRAACKAAIPSAEWPREPTPRAEQTLLDHLGAHTLIEKSDAGWELHALRDALPMVAVVRREASPLRSAASEQALGPAASAPPRATAGVSESRQPVPCVGIWGLALPAGPKSWTAYVFLPTNSEGPSRGNAPTDIPLPPGATKSLAFSSTSGGVVVSFRGPGPAQPEVWKRTFDRWLTDGGWLAPEGWRASGDGWYLRGRRDGAAAAMVDVRFSPGPMGGLDGIVLVTPRRAVPTESSNP
jgi:hypothetical protein